MRQTRLIGNCLIYFWHSEHAHSHVIRRILDLSQVFEVVENTIEDTHDLSIANSNALFVVCGRCNMILCRSFTCMQGTEFVICHTFQRKRYVSTASTEDSMCIRYFFVATLQHGKEFVKNSTVLFCVFFFF